MSFDQLRMSGPIAAIGMFAPTPLMVSLSNHMGGSGDGSKGYSMPIYMDFGMGLDLW